MPIHFGGAVFASDCVLSAALDGMPVSSIGVMGLGKLISSCSVKFETVLVGECVGEASVPGVDAWLPLLVELVVVAGHAP